MQPETIVQLSIDLLVPNPNQPRKLFIAPSLTELSKSIKKYGILNPILVRKKEDKYEIIAGERRFRAAKMAGLKEVPAIVKDVNDQEVNEIALIENLQRENLTPIDEARTYDDIIAESGTTAKELGESIGRPELAISNKIKLLELPIEIQDALSNRKISEKHAKTLLTVTDEEKQVELLKKVIAERLSVKELENIVLNKEEEKESDNMNNGSFFPNFSNQEQNPQDVSLNQMNMQTMGAQSPEAPAAPVIEPAAVPEAPVAPILPTQPEAPAAPVLPQVEIQNMGEPAPASPEINSEVVSPIPEFGVNSAPTPVEAPILPTQPEPLPQVETPAINPMPIEEPVPAAEPIPAAPEPVAPVDSPVINPVPAEAPLFNQELNNQEPTPNLNESFYEVPVNVSPVIEAPAGDKFQQVEQLLSSNNIEYKAYSNETGHCIIIEL